MRYATIFYQKTWKLRWWFSQLPRRASTFIRSSIPSWSILRTLGSSKIVGATMFVPFLGTLLLFNQSVLEAIRIPEELINAWGMNLPISSKDASLLRLKLTYFGLCFVGIASFIFTLMCPEVVKRYGSSAEYVRGDEPLFTGPQIEDAAGTIISNFIYLSREKEYGREPTFSCPPPLLRQTTVFLGELATLMLQKREEEESLHSQERPEGEDQTEEEQVETEEEQAARWEQEEKHFLWNRHSPGADVDKIVNLIENGDRVDQMMFYTLSKLGRGFSADTMSLSYFWQNYSRPLIRLIISLIFAAGFFLLSIPTIFTFVSVLRQTIY